MRRRPWDTLSSSDVTPESVYRERRRFLQGLVLAGSAPWLTPARAVTAGEGPPLAFSPAGPGTPGFIPGETLTPWEHVTGYNNFYELGMDKGDPAANADRLVTRPWSVVVEGEVGRPGRYTLEDILRPHALEERIYRLRCVEAWSMVIPWVGFPLADLLRRFEPTSRAKYVAFESIHDPEHLPGQRPRLGGLDWPYVEGLRMDEAMHPLTLMAVGLYGRVLPNQNGAPLRLVVPWKYGFKSIKSIVRIRLQERMPPTTWNRMAPEEYGFYANVNPAVDHPRWSQKTERRLPGTLFNPNRIATQLFNGYAEQVAGLYAGMNLARHY